MKRIETSGDGFSTIEISHKSESNDPRVGGTKIIFDSRLDNPDREETAELDAFLKAKKNEKKPKTELEK